jgi:hypothetical protein
MAEHDELTEENFFSTDDVYKIAALVNENLAGVVYHYWVNKASGTPFEVLDWITLAFKSGNSITFTAGLETDGIRVDEPDFTAERTKLEAEFEGKVTIESRDVSKHKMWKSAIGQDITPSLMRFEGRVINDSLVLKFEDADSVEIFLGIEGLEVDFFDEDEDSGMTDVQA